MTTGKTIALTKWTLVGKVMSLLSNMLSRLVITFLPRSKGLLISWLQSKSAVLNILCRPHLLPPSIIPSIRVFSNESVLHIIGRSIGISASVLPMNIQNRLPLGWTGWISLLSKGLSRVFSNTTVQKHQFFGTQPSSQSNSHIHT